MIDMLAAIGYAIIAIFVLVPAFCLAWLLKEIL